MVPADQDDPAEDEDGRGDEQEDVADVEEPLVLWRSGAPSPEGHHTCSWDQRHLSRLFCKIEYMLLFTSQKIISLVATIFHNICDHVFWFYPEHITKKLKPELQSEMWSSLQEEGLQSRPVAVSWDQVGTLAPLLGLAGNATHCWCFSKHLALIVAGSRFEIKKIRFEQSAETK